jgi:hypothetical protein
MMGAEPGRPNELSPITRIDTARVRPVQSAAGRSFTESGSPWQNPFVESSGSRVRDEVLAAESFDPVLEAQTVITDWRTIDHHRQPHSSPGWRPPAAYAASLTTNKPEKPARLSQRPDRQTGAGHPGTRSGALINNSSRLDEGGSTSATCSSVKSEGYRRCRDARRP